MWDATEILNLTSVLILTSRKKKSPPEKRPDETYFFTFKKSAININLAKQRLYNAI